MQLYEGENSTHNAVHLCPSAFFAAPLLKFCEARKRRWWGWRGSREAPGKELQGTHRPPESHRDLDTDIDLINMVHGFGSL